MDQLCVQMHLNRQWWLKLLKTSIKGLFWVSQQEPPFDQQLHIQIYRNQITILFSEWNKLLVKQGSLRRQACLAKMHHKRYWLQSHLQPWYQMILHQIYNCPFDLGSQDFPQKY